MFTPQLLNAVLSMLGISAFDKDADGRFVITDTQAAQLTAKYGERFVTAFRADLAAYKPETTAVAASAAAPADSAAAAAQLSADAAALAAARARLAELDATIAAQKATIAKLERNETTDTATAVEAAAGGAGAAGVTKRFTPDMRMAHNLYIDTVHKGAVYSGNTTIDTKELETEFGRYVSGERMEILRGLMGKTSSTEYMSSIVSDKVEVRAMDSAIESVLQQFVPWWTPKGKTKFTPLTIKNFKCKINVPVIPSDIMDQLLGYLYDENLEPKDMPIVKYILTQLVFPKLDEERELALALGEFKENKAAKDGDDAGAPMDAMDGYVTLLRRLRAQGNKQVTFLLPGEELTDEKLLSQIDRAVDQVKPLYKGKTMFIHADPNLVTRYGRAYRAKYPYTKNEDGEKLKVDFSRFTFAPLEGMRDTGVFFITPKENFKHLSSKNPQNTRVWMQGENYAVKIFGEWWEGVGFWLAEAIFAYLPPEKAK
jgi:hypothetical protein